MQKTDNDFSYRLGFLKRINNSKINGEEVRNLSLRGYNVWHFYQNSIFFGDLKRFTNNILEPKFNFVHFIVDKLVQIFSLLLSLAGIILLRFGNKEILVFSIDKTSSNKFNNDHRLDPLYHVISQKNFLEIFHSKVGSELGKNFIKRQRVAIYDVAIDFLFNILNFFHSKTIIDIDLSLFNENEKEIAERILKKYFKRINLSEFRIKFFIKILKKSKIKQIFAIDDPRDYNELMVAARNLQIPVTALQHGHFTKYHVGWLQNGLVGEIARPHKILVWSEYWKNELERLGSYFLPNEIIVGGPKPEIKLNYEPITEEETTVLVPYEVDSDKEKIKEYIDAFLNNQYKVIFKTRKDLSEEKQLQESKISYVYHPKLEISSDTNTSLSKSHIVAGSYSTFLYDAIENLKPVLYLETGIDFGEGLVINNLAYYISNTKDIEGLYSKIKQIQLTELKEKKEKLLGKNPPNIFDMINKQLI